MKKVFTSYQFWLILTILTVVTLIVVCITFAANYFELEAYRNSSNKDIQNTSVQTSSILPQEVVSALKEQSTPSMTEQSVEQLPIQPSEAGTLATIAKEFIDGFYFTDGSESNNEIAFRVEKYVTSKVFDELYDEMEEPISYAEDERIASAPNIKTTMYTIGKDNLTAISISLVDITHYYSARGFRKPDTGTILVMLDYEYDVSSKLWKISGVRTSNINMHDVWGR